MHAYTAVIERCPDTNLYVGYVPGFAGAHSQGAILDELNANLGEVIAMLLDEGEPKLDAEFVGTQDQWGQTRLIVDVRPLWRQADQNQSSLTPLIR